MASTQGSSEVEVSLQGTLETFAVPDVLSLLAATRKTGELRVDGERSRGRLWLDGGRVVGADVAQAVTFVDAVFELLRLTGGSFSFGGEGRAPKPADPVAVDDLLTDAQERLGAWRAIEAVVPSLACPVRLVPALQGEEATVSSRQWKALVAVVTGGDVNGVMHHLEVGEFDACKTVKELVDAGLVTVEAAPATPAPAPAPPSAPEPAQAPAPAPAEAASTPTPPATEPAGRPAAPAAARIPSSRRAPADPAGTPAPEAGSARTPVAARPAAEPAPAAPVPPALAPRRPGTAPSLLEAEELVHQLASLRSAPPRPEPADSPAPAAATPAPAAAAAAPDKGTGKGAGKGAGKGEGGDEGQETAEEEAGEGSSGAGGTAPAAAGGRSEEEPINRGMLLKFLSSVRS